MPDAIVGRALPGSPARRADRRLVATGGVVLLAWSVVALAVPGITIAGLIRYVAGFLFLVLLPACHMVRRVFPRLGWFERVAIAAPFGIAAVTVLFWILQLTRLDILAVPFAVALGVVGIAEIWLARAQRDQPSPRPDTLWISLALVAAAWTAAGVSGFFVALSTQADGSLLYRDVPFDTRFHVVITSELLRSVPPQTPYFPGFPLNYHYFFDLFTVVMHRVSGVPLFPLLSCLQFSLFLATLALSSVAFVAALTESAFATTVTSALMFFGGSPFNVIVGPWLLGGSRAWEHSFHGQSAMALFVLNPQGIGLALITAGFLAAIRRPTARPFASGLIAGFLIGAGCAFKMFTGLLTIGAMAVAAVIGRARRLPTHWPVLLAAMVVGATLAAYFLSRNAHSGNLAVTIKPGFFVLFGLEYLGLTQLHAYASSVYDGVRHDPTAIGAGVALVVVLLIGNLGFRLPALRRLAGDVLNPSFERRTIAVMFWTGLLIFVFVQLKPADWPNYYNNAGWFNHTGLTMSAILVAEHWDRARVSGRRVLSGLYWVLTLAAVLSMLQFFVATARLERTTISRDDATALAFLRDHTEPTSVVLVNANPYHGGYANVEMLAERRVYLGADWSQASVRKADIDARVQAVETFFTHPEAGEIILHDGISYVWVDNAKDSAVNTAVGQTSCADPSVRAGSLPLACAFRNERFTVYRVTSPVR